MIDVAAVKSRVLEKAIRGELVPNIGSIEQVDSMLKRISEEYQDLLNRKETKISKVAEMNSDDIYDIPDNWKWVPLGKLCIMLSRGKSPKYSDEKKYPVFAQKCNQPNSLALWKALFLDPDSLEKWPEYFRLRDKDVVINSTGTGTVGRIGYYMTETLDSAYPFMLPDSHVTVVRTGEGIVSKYIYYVLRSISLQNIMEKTFRGSTNQKEFYIDSVYATPIPVPSTEEQILIVNKLDEVFGQLQLIEELQLQYKLDLEVLKSKIIDAGIQGKLTEQLPEDGTAEELLKQIAEEKKLLIKEKKIKTTKALPGITEEEIPFEIPDNWIWVRLDNIARKVFAGGDKPEDFQKEKDVVHPYPVVANGVKDDGILGYSAKYTAESDTVTVAGRGTIGFSVYRDYKYCPIVRLIVVEPSDGINPRYLKYVFQGMPAGSVGSSIPQLTVPMLKPKLIPLPPANEQNRIVARIDEVLEQIEMI